MARTDKYKSDNQTTDDNQVTKVSHLTKVKEKFSQRSLKGKVFVIFRKLVALGFIAVVATLIYTAITVGKINQETLYSHIERPSVLYDITGEEIDTLHYAEERKIVSIGEMPDNLKNAFIAIEDKTFYKHHGFNFRRMFGAVLAKLTGRSSSISGTSTITQQLARNAYLSEIKSRRSLRRKISEMYIAWQLERKFTKDEILEAYLNTIYLGYGNYGVGAAARTYFSKTVDDLTLAESAALAALPQAPDAYALISQEGEPDQEIKEINYYSLDSLDEEEAPEEEEYTDPYASAYGEEAAEEEEGTGFYANDVSKERRDLVLELMKDQGYISEGDVSEATVDIIDILHPSFEKSGSAYTYFTDYLSGVVVKDLMEKYKMDEEEAQRMVYTGGLKIHTTVNSEIQNAIYDEFQDDSNFPETEDGSKPQAAMVVTEVGTGYVSAMVGGRDADGAKLFNRAVSPRQPGSSIKPLAVYGAALQRSFDYAAKGEKFHFTDYGFDSQGTNYWGDYITASSGVIDEPLKINGEEWPQNFTRTYSGSNSLRTALQQSINTCAVKILWQVGLEYSAEMLEKYGLTTLVTDTNESANDINPAALALGAMTYGVTPLEMAMAYAVYPNEGVLNTPVCYTKVTDEKDNILLTPKSEETKVLDEGVAWIMVDLLKSVVSRGIAGNAAISGVEVGGKTGTTNDTYDVWFDGFTPNYAGVLWIGTDLNVEMYGNSGQAAALWSKIMRQAPDIKSGAYAEMPKNIVKQNGEYYTKGTEKNAGKFGGRSKKKSSGGSSDDDKKKKLEEEAKKKAEEAKKKEQAKGSGEPPSDDKSGGGSGGGSGGSGGGSSGGQSGGGSDSGSGGGSDSGSGGGSDSGSGGGSDSGSGGDSDSGSDGGSDSGSGGSEGTGGGEPPSP